MPVLLFFIHSDYRNRASSPMRYLHFPLLMVVAGGLAHADTLYKCSDEAGHTTYTNQKSSAKNCAVLLQDKPVSTFSAPQVKPRQSAPTPEGFPKVSPDAQKSRDGDRRAILEQELAAERRNLEEAKRVLAEQESIREGGERNYQRVLDRLKPYQENVQLHERNIEALQREIGNLK